jgi:hypothetical protein
MRTMEQCLVAFSNSAPGHVEYEAAKAEFDILMAQKHFSLLQKTRENVDEILSAMNSEISRFREVVDRAAADSSVTSHLVIR